MSNDLDDLVRRRAEAVGQSSPELDASGLWSAGRQKRRRRRGALAGAGTLLAAALVGGIAASAVGGNDAARSPAVASTPTESPLPAVTTPAPSPSPPDTAGLPGPLVAAIEGLAGTGRHIFGDQGAPSLKQVDTAKTLQDIGNADIKVALLPASDLGTHQTPAQLAAELGTRIGDKAAVVIVIVGQQPGAAAGIRTGFEPGTAETTMMNAQSMHAGAFTEANVQGALDAAIAIYVEQLNSQGNATPGLLEASSPPAATTVPPVQSADRVVGDCANAQFEPASIIVACGDAGIRAIDLKYTTYGPVTAAGTGMMAVNQCKPDCADGTFLESPMTFVLDQLKTYGGHPTFSRLRVTYSPGYSGVTGGPEDTFSLQLPPLTPVN